MIFNVNILFPIYLIAITFTFMEISISISQNQQEQQILESRWKKPLFKDRIFIKYIQPDFFGEKLLVTLKFKSGFKGVSIDKILSITNTSDLINFIDNVRLLNLQKSH